MYIKYFLLCIYESEGIDLLRYKHTFLVNLNKLAFISLDILQETPSPSLIQC
jgi:hypothetical protein